MLPVASAEMALPPVAAVIWDALTVIEGLVFEALLPSVRLVAVTVLVPAVSRIML